ncbi:MAG: AAA domain-containing protein [Thermomicrobiales bacterium]
MCDGELIGVCCDLSRKAIAQLEGSGVVPEGILDLIEISDDAFDVEIEGSANSQGHGNRTLYFPLEANEEQLEIIDRLERRNAVLVQGPPGTGKSHTIANLISHLLATGQRVLVTSHTPRALRVLREKIPSDIQSLCVSLVGTDRTAIEEVEASVLGITQRFDQYDRRKQLQEIGELEHQLDSQRKGNAVVAGELRALRERATFHHVLGFDGYEGTAQRIAERLSIEEERFGWIPGAFTPELEPPLTDREAENLLRIIRHLTPARRAFLESLTITSEDVPYPEEFGEFVTRERLARQASDAHIEFLSSPYFPRISRMDRLQRAELGSQVFRLRQQFMELRKHSSSTADKLFEALDAGNYRLLKQLHTDSSDTVQQVGNFASVMHCVVIGLDHLDRATVLRDATALLAHLRDGGGKGLPGMRPKVVKDTEYLTRSVFVDGMPCRDESTLGRLLSWLNTRQMLDAICRRWEQFERVESATVARQSDELSQLTDALGTVLFIWDGVDALFRDAGISASSSTVTWETDWQLQEIARLLEAVEAEEIAKQATAALDLAVSSVTSRPCAHPLVAEFVAAIEDRSIEGYRDCFSSLVQCDEDRLQVDLRDLLFDRLQASAPDLLELLVTTCDDPVWETRFSEFQRAWAYARANAWMERFEQPGRLTKLLKHLDAGHARERMLVQQLSAELAWFHFFDRMTQSQSQHLRAWALAVRKIGKGTGKYAAAHRQNAREHMEHCRPAIPAWIMPIYRVTETLRPNVDTFDVVIVDEASQSGPEALFLQYIAKKIVIVGDDKQISPTSFTDQEAVDLLRKRNIDDLPHSETLGVNNSFFDQAVIRYSGRVQLREHFRCMPEIIQFSNNLAYSNSPLIPLRQYGVDRLEPVLTTYVAEGYESTTIGTRDTNPAEAEAIVQQIIACCADSRYDNRTMGVISLLGNRQQELIGKRLLELLGPEEIQRRRLDSGGPYDFQGDERDVIFLSLVISPTPRGGRPKPAQTSEVAKRSFNVAASRARDQLWLFHSVTLNDLLNPDDVRRKLLEYCLHPHVESAEFEFPSVADSELVAPFESLFEQQVYLRIRARGFRVLPQVKVGGYRIDLVVEGLRGRLAVECDGDQWHGPERYDYDMGRQRQLERAGWTFWRVSGSDFYRNPEQSLSELWEVLDRLGIHPNARSAPSVGLSFAPNDAGSTISEDARVDLPLRSNSDGVGLEFIGMDAMAGSDEPGASSEDLIVGADNDCFQVGPTDLVSLSESHVTSVPMPTENASSEQRRFEVRSVELDEITSPLSQTRFEIEIEELVLDLDATVEPRVATAVEQYAEIARSFMIPYQHWNSRSLQNPFDRPSREIVKELVEIIEAEGPVLCRRVYNLYATAAGFESERQIRSVLNSALHNAYTQRQIEYANEWGKPGQIDDILRSPGRSRVRLRSAGGRNLQELPPSEVAEFVHLVAEECEVVDRGEAYVIFDGVLSAYGISVDPTSKHRADLWELIKKGIKR